jgi:2-keto-4-pentenoate hydratase
MATQATPSEAQHTTPISAADRNRMHRAAEILLAARRERAPIAVLPEDLRPSNLAEAYALQDILALSCSPIGGWKIGAPSPDATPLFCPMPLWGGFARAGNPASIPGSTKISSHFHRMRGVEAEIAFVLGEDLPRREQPYTQDEVAAAVGSAHPAIEILESAFLDPDRSDRLSVLGDLQMNGGFVLGPAFAGWSTVDFAQESVRVVVDGAIRFEGTASNTAGTNLLRLVTYLANEGAARTGGLRKGDVVTTGSWSGKTLADAGSVVEIAFTRFGALQIIFE